MERGPWHCTGAGDQNQPQEKEMQKPKCLSEEGLQIAEKRKEVKHKREKERYIYLNAEFQRTDKKSFLNDPCKEIEENNRMGNTRALFKKVRDTMGKFHGEIGTIKDRNGMDVKEGKTFLIS